MWRVTIIEYNRYAGESMDYTEDFSDKSDALSRCESLKKYTNIGVYLEELTQIGEDEYMDGNEVVCTQSIQYD